MRYLVFVGVILMGVTAGARPVQACSCAVPPPPTDALATAAAVFAGEVIDIDNVSDGDGITWLRVRLRVEASWKGGLEETVEVRTASNSAACGFGFQQDRAYLVYANEHDGQLHVSLCSRTTAFEEADTDLEALGPPTEFGQLPSDGPNGGRCGGPTSAAAMQVVFFTLLGVAVLRRCA